MKQLSEWVSTEEDYPPAEGWYLVRFETSELATRIAMHYRPKRKEWFVEGGPCYPWGGLQPKYWLNLV